jgi:hypothetical protein
MKLSALPKAIACMVISDNTFNLSPPVFTVQIDGRRQRNGCINRWQGGVDESVNACLRGDQSWVRLENGGPIERREGYWRRL